MRHVDPRRRTRLSTLVGAVLCGCAIAGVLAGSASSAFPGSNGKIVFASGDQFCCQDVHVMAPDGTGVTQLTNTAGNDQNPVWSANGTKIAFASAREGNDKIFTMNADGSGPARVTDSALFHDVEPSWSPDGSKIAFRSDRVNSFQIWVVNADGTGLTQLTDDPAVTALRVTPVWSPDGSKILFAGSDDGDFEIFVMNADGSNQTQLTSNTPSATTTASDTNADWSPDGTKIVYQSNEDGDFDVYVMNADGSGRTQLTTDPAFDSGPSWSPDGTKIVFQSTRDSDGDFEIFTMNADGTGQAQLTSNTTTDRVADWQPIPTGGNDTTPPILTLPANLTVDATSPAGALVSFVATASDAVDPAPTVACAPPSGSTFAIASTTVACTAMDASGNSTGGSFVVTVRGAGGQLTELVQELVAGSALPPSVRNVLLSLAQSFDPANPAHVRAACRSLGALATILRFVPGPQAAAWRADANRIRAVLGC